MPAQATVRKGEVVNFDPVNVAGKKVDVALAEIARGVNNLHQCVHAGHEAQAERDRVADAKREALAGEVGEIKAQQEVDGGRITKLARMFGAAEHAPGEKAQKPTVGMGWKEHAKLAATILGSLSGFVLLLQLLAPGIAATWEAIMKAQP